MKATRMLLAPALAIASLIIGSGIAMAGAGGHDARVAGNWVPNLATQYSAQVQSVSATCRSANQTAARASFSRLEAKLDAKLAAGRYYTMVNGKVVTVTSPTYDDIASALDHCPKG